MKNWTKLAVSIAALTALLAWYVFRPEWLVVNRRVDEGLTNAQGSLPVQALVSGCFYSILHPEMA